MIIALPGRKKKQINKKDINLWDLIDAESYPPPILFFS